MISILFLLLGSYVKYFIIYKLRYAIILIILWKINSLSCFYGCDEWTTKSSSLFLHSFGRCIPENSYQKLISFNFSNIMAKKSRETHLKQVSHSDSFVVCYILHAMYVFFFWDLLVIFFVSSWKVSVVSRFKIS